MDVILSIRSTDDNGNKLKIPVKTIHVVVFESDMSSEFHKTFADLLANDDEKYGEITESGHNWREFPMCDLDHVIPDDLKDEWARIRTWAEFEAGKLRVSVSESIPTNINVTGYYFDLENLVESLIN